MSGEHVVAGFSPRSTLKFEHTLFEVERGLKPATTCSPKVMLL